eukprot:TRINITY_DN2891_c0_g2_i1.p1 TRINITY_DN2891_c0_g2~~TRINITY_DN2891_c0_g2_i1.p1  ORF type:complete len:125 (-),score=10.76 TRINITY_DN2891_c0_g2_i1:58-432(-)
MHKRKGLTAFIGFELEFASPEYKSLKPFDNDCIYSQQEEYSISYSGSGVDITHPSLKQFRTFMMIEDKCDYCCSSNVLSILYLYFDHTGNNISLSMEAVCKVCGVFSVIKYPEPVINANSKAPW